MRLKITLSTPASGATLPIDYQYPLQQAVYRLLAAGSKQFASFLHGQGFPRGKRTYKLFTYSWLQIPAGKRRIEDGRLRIEQGGVDWEVSSPVEGFVSALKKGLAGESRIEIGPAAFRIQAVQSVAPPIFRPSMRFSCLTPIVVSTPRDAPSRLTERRSAADSATSAVRLYPEFVEPGPRCARLLRANLAAKYELISGGGAPAGALAFEFDPQYVQRVGGRISKLKEFKGHPVRGYMAPFQVEGPPELIAVGYECGFGEKNSGGFGMVKPVEAAGKRR